MFRPAWPLTGITIMKHFEETGVQAQGRQQNEVTLFTMKTNFKMPHFPMKCTHLPLKYIKYHIRIYSSQ